MTQDAFTLAEVLITLGIIGVVAAMTIPTLMNNIQDQQLHTQFKKAFSTLNQSLSMLKAYDETIDFTSQQSLADSFSKRLLVLKKGTEDTLGHTTKQYKSSSDMRAITTLPAIILKDGTMLIFDAWGTNLGTPECKKSSYTQSGQTVTDICATIDIDVNGAKSPNMLGKDFFRVWVRQVGDDIQLYPMGYMKEFPCTVGNGYGCATNVISGETMP